MVNEKLFSLSGLLYPILIKSSYSQLCKLICQFRNSHKINWAQ